MKNNNRSIVVYALFSVVIIASFYIAVQPLQEAWALDTRTFAVNGCGGSSMQTTFYEPVNNYFISITSICNSSTSTSMPMTIVNANNGALIANYTLNSLHGNTTVPVRGSIAGNVFGLWCNSLYCFDMWDTGSASTTQIQKWRLSNGAPLSYFNGSQLNSAGTFITDSIWGNGGTVQGSLGTLYSIQALNSNNHRAVILFGMGCTGCISGAHTDLPIQQVANQLDIGLPTINTGQIDGCINCGGSTGTLRLGVESKTSGGNFVITVVDLSSLTVVCQSALGSLTTTSGGAFKYSGNTLDKWMLTDQTQVYFVNRDACTISTTVTATNLGTAGATILSIGINPTVNQYYVYGFISGNQAFASVMNASNLAQRITTLFAPSTNAVALNGHFQQMAIGTSNAQVLLTDSGKVAIIYYLNGVSGGGGGTGTSTCGDINPALCVGSVDCGLPQNINLVTCFVNITSTNGNNAFNNGVNVLNNTNSVIAQGLGISNQNIKTNGIGYLYLVVALILANIMWLLAVHNFSSRGIIVPQPIFVSALLSFAVIFGFVLMGITDPLFLIVSIVALVAFASPKLVGMLRGNSPEATA